MSDYIKREDAKDAVINIVGWEKIAKYVDEMSKHPSTKDIDYYDALIDAEDVIDDLPSADVALVRHEEDGTLWVTVRDCETVGRVIVRNEQGHFCRVFYMGDGDEEPVRHGRWEDEFKEDAEAFVKHRYVCTVCGEWQTYGKTQYCPNCGAKMDEGGKSSASIADVN